MDGSTQTGKNEVILLNESTNTPPANLEAEVQKILSGTNENGSESNSLSSGLNEPVKKRDFKHEYQLRKKRKSKGKKVRSKTVATKKTVESGSSDIGEASEGKTDPDTKSGYASYKEKWFNSLDPDAREDSGPDQVVSDPNEIQTQGEGGAVSAAPKRKFGNSLVVLTQFVLPILCTVATRLISRGKKRPENESFRLNDFDKAMLKELADDGAGEEILGGVNQSLIYFIVVFSLGANKVMDQWDKDAYQEKMTEVTLLSERLEALTQKYNDLTKDDSTALVIAD